VGRKALILARTLGWRMELSEVAIEPLFPAEMANLPVKEFMAGLGALDAEYAVKVCFIFFVFFPNPRDNEATFHHKRKPIFPLPSRLKSLVTRHSPSGSGGQGAR
jgi:hypothetical protein